MSIDISSNQPVHILSDLGALKRTYLSREYAINGVEFKARTEFLGIGVYGYDPDLRLA